MSPTPKFQPGETMNIVRYIPPLPKGATVTVKRIEYRGEEYQYVVEGRRIPQGDLIEVWADEIDLKVPLFFDVPRKKRRGSREMPSYPVVAPAATIAPATSGSTINGSSSSISNAVAPPSVAPKKRRSRTLPESVGIIPTQTGRSKRSRALESALYADPAQVKVEHSSAAALKQETNAMPASALLAAERKPRKKRSAVRGSSPTETEPAVKAGPAPRATKRSVATAPSANEPGARTNASRKAGRPDSNSAPTQRSSASGKSADSAGIATATRPAATRRKKAAASEPVAQAATPTRSGRKSPERLQVEKPARPAPKKRKKKRASSKAGTTKPASKADAVLGSRATTGSAKAPAGRKRQTRKTGIEPISTSEPVRRRRSSQTGSGGSVGEILDGVLSGRSTPGGMVFGGNNGVPIVIIIVNAGGDPSAETGRKRRS